jgi:glycosyltransferase involved in cell wall biosynthesis
VETFVRLYKEKPDVVLVASPPVVAAVPVYLYVRLRNIPFVIDAHTGVFDDPRWTWLLPLSRLLSRSAVATLVTNDHLEGIVRSWGAQALILDVVPMSFPGKGNGNLRSDCNFAIINTFSRDEPMEAVIAAAKNFPEVVFYVTGDVTRASSTLQKGSPANVHFTGWLEDGDYANLLRNATAIMVLTTRDHTMQRGALEAMELEKPLITSNWPLLRQTFSRGTIHVDNSVEGITAAIDTVLRDREWLESEMKALRAEKIDEFKINLKRLLTLVRSHPHFTMKAKRQKPVAQ